jgi:hypothetical protein
MASSITSSKGSTSTSRGLGCVGGVVFMGAGLVFVVAMIAGVAHDYRVAHTYLEAACTVTGKHPASGKNAPLAYLDVSYEVDGHARSAKNLAQRIVNPNLTVGAHATCFYDPEAPASVVIERPTPLPMGGMLFGLAFPGIFVVVGLRSILQALHDYGKSREAILAEAAMGHARANPRAHAESTKANASPYRAGKRAHEPFDPDDLEGLPLPKVVTIKGKGLPFRVVRGQRRSAELGGMAFAAAFWNGMLSIFVIAAFHGAPLVFVLFLIPFVLVGLWLLVAVVRRILLFAVREPVLELSSHPLRLGHPTLLTIAQGGPIRATTLRVVLRGVEEAVVNAGKSSQVHKSTFFEEELASDALIELPRGRRWKREREVTIPSGNPTSFASAHNSIHYEIVVTAALENLPDDENVYPILVLPRVEDVDA